MLSEGRLTSFDPSHSNRLYAESKACLGKVDEILKKGDVKDTEKFHDIYLLIPKAIEKAKEAASYSKNKQFYENYYKHIAEKIFYAFSKMHKIIYQGNLKEDYVKSMNFFKLIENASSELASAKPSEVRRLQNYAIYSSLFLLLVEFLKPEKKSFLHSILDMLEKCQYTLSIAKYNCTKKEEFENLRNHVVPFFFRDLPTYWELALKEINDNNTASAIKKFEVLERLYYLSHNLNSIYNFLHNKNYMFLLRALQSNGANLPRLEIITEISDLQRYQKLLELKIQHWHMIRGENGFAIDNDLYSYYHLLSVVYEKQAWHKKNSGEQLLLLVKAGEQCLKTIKWLEPKQFDDTQMKVYLMEERRKLVRYCINYNAAKHQNPNIQIGSDYPISIVQAIETLKDLAKYYAIDISYLIEQDKEPYFIMESSFKHIFPEHSYRKNEKYEPSTSVRAMQLFIKDEYTRFGPSYRPNTQTLKEWDEACNEQRLSTSKLGKKYYM